MADDVSSLPNLYQCPESNQIHFPLIKYSPKRVLVSPNAGNDYALPPQNTTPSSASLSPEDSSTPSSKSQLPPNNPEPYSSSIKAYSPKRLSTARGLGVTPFIILEGYSIGCFS
jgi:hypothetical protein